ncbi:hypothetical protein AB0H12_39955 [Actinosynnema sp. NPDC023794]
MVKPKNKATTKSRTRKLGAAVAAMVSVAGMLLAAAPATAAAYPTTDFYVWDSKGSYYSGTVTWYNRSVGITGTFNTVGCRRVYGEAWANTRRLDWGNSALWCNHLRTQSIPLDANVAGGATTVVVGMADENAVTYLDYVTCYRGDSVCEWGVAGAVRAEQDN